MIIQRILIDFEAILEKFTYHREDFGLELTHGDTRRVSGLAFKWSGNNLVLEKNRLNPPWELLMLLLKGASIGKVAALRSRLILVRLRLCGAVCDDDKTELPNYNL